MHNMRLLVITQFSALGGSSRIQVIQFFPFLKKAGIEYRHGTVYSDRFYRMQNGIVRVSRGRKTANFLAGMLAGFIKKAYWVCAVARYDAVLIQREVFPPSWYWIMRHLNPRIIYEIEDTIFEINPFWHRVSIHNMAMRYQARGCRTMMRHAAHVIAENEYLAREARKHNRNVSLLTAPIDTDRFTPGDKNRGRDPSVIIGWIGSPGTSYLLKNLEPMFVALGGRYPQMTVKAVGTAPDFTMAGFHFTSKNWTQEEELADLQSFDIGIMPLDDMPFNRGRLGYKMIQYMAVGLPVVAADVGLNRTVIRDGGNGFLAATDEDWIQKLGLLIGDASLRTKMGGGGRRMARDPLSLLKQAQHLVGVIRLCIPNL